MRLLGEALIQPDWCPYKKKSGHTDTTGTHMQREFHVKTEKTSTYKTRGEASEDIALLPP